MNKRIRQIATERLLTVKEASVYSGIAEEALQQRIYRGRLDAVLKARTYLIDKNDLDT